MRPPDPASHPAGSAPERPRWHVVLRALREARGVTQEGWATQLSVSRKTVQRWEAGERTPDPGAEAAILAYCDAAGLFRPFARGPLAGLALTPEVLHDLLAEARLDLGRPAPAGTGGGTGARAGLAPAPPPAASARRSNLPAALTSFVGREQELAAVRRTLGGTRLLTLVGAGGCGKTRLALALAEELLWAYPHGVWFVELAALADPALVPATVAAALGLWTTDERPVTELLVAHLAPRHLLLVLDNCEHLLGACAVLVETLLRACPHLEVLTTSREPLGIGSEALWRVPSLSLPDHPAAAVTGDAVRLFAERAQQYRPDFALTAANEAAVVQICEQLDGIPLALELAAACVKLLSAEQIAARLSDRFRLLTGGSRTALPRQQTLRATMDWSWELLTVPEQALLRRLAVFAGGFVLEAAEAVGAGGGGPDGSDVLALLAAVVDKSLVIAEQPQAGVVRYRLLETVRQYAAEQLGHAAETEPTRDRHRAWYRALAQAAGAAVQGPAEPAWLTRLEQEHDNLRAALAWSLAHSAEQGAAALRLAGALPRFWELRGHLSEGRQWLAQALEAGACAPAEARAVALNGAAVLAQMQGDYVAAQALAEESLALSQQAQHRQGIAEAYWSLGYVALRCGEHDDARTSLEASLAVHTELESRAGIAGAHGALGVLTLRQGDYEAARSHFEASLALHREIGDKDGTAAALVDLATVAEDEGADAKQTALLEESLMLYREIGNRQGIALVLGNLGMAAWMRGDHERALTLLEESLTLYREVGDRRGIARLLGSQSLVALYQRNYARAAALCQDSLTLYQTVGDRWSIARYLSVAAGAAFGQGQPQRAAQLFGAAATLREHLGGTLPPAIQPSHDRTVAAIRAALGDVPFEAAWAAGQAMSAEAAVAYALAGAAPA